MVKIGIIVNNDDGKIDCHIDKYLYDIYKSLSNMKCFDVYLILNKHSEFILNSAGWFNKEGKDINKRVCDNIQNDLETMYMENITLFINVNKKDTYNNEYCVFYNIKNLIPKVSEKDNTMVFILVNKSTGKEYTLNLKNDPVVHVVPGTTAGTTTGSFKNIINSDELVRVLLSSDKSTQVISNNNNIYVFKNDRIQVSKAPVNNFKSYKHKYNINFNVYTNWCDSKSLIPHMNKQSKDDKTSWLFKNRKITIHSDFKNPDFNLIINSTTARVSEKTIYTCMEPPFNPSFLECYNNSKNAGITYYGNHEFHQNFIDWHLNLTYNDLVNSLSSENENIFKKKDNDKVLSIIVSSQYNDPGHKLRINFIKEMDKRSKEGKLPFGLDIYGRCQSLHFHNYRGELPNCSKEEGLKKYKYHFNAENFSVANYVTEKFTDSIMCECLIFYWGCPNLEDIYDSKCFVRLSLLEKNHDKEIDLIYNTMNNNEYEKRLSSIIETKKDILFNRSLFPKLNNIITLSETNVYALKNKETVSDYVYNKINMTTLTNSCFKIIQILEYTSTNILTVFYHMLTTGQDLIMINDPLLLNCNTLYNKISNVCLDTYDIIIVGETTNILKSNLWMRIDILEEIFYALTQMVSSNKNVILSDLLVELVKKYKIKNIK